MLPRLQIILYVLLILLAAIVLVKLLDDDRSFHVGSAEAHHQSDFFNIPRSSYLLVTQMEEIDAWPWSYEQRCGNANILADIQGTMLDTQSRYGTPHPQVLKALPNTVQNWVSTCGPDFTVHCGGGFAVACVGSEGRGYPLNCDAFINGAYMATFYSFESRKSVPKHELLHCEDGRAEAYDDVNWDCFPPGVNFTDTVMGCGPQHSLDYTPRDDWNHFIFHYPPPLSQAGPTSYYGVFTQQDKTFVYYCATSVNANRVYLYYDRGDGLVWSGERLLDAKGPNTCRSVEVYPGWCYWLKQTNAVADLRYANEVKVGCT